MKQGNIQDIKYIHFVGIKGVAMTALAVWAHEKKIKVTGSDVEDHFPTDSILNSIKVYPEVGFHPDHIKKGIDMVIYTGAHNGSNNIEVVTARKKGITTLPHGKALGFFMQLYRQISVAGCHGKTTTTALIATILFTKGFDPSYAIGCGEVFKLGKPGHFGIGDWFVAEADEYVTDPINDTTPRYFWQKPEIFVITNIDFDHPDVYHDISCIKEKFKTFILKNSNLQILVINQDDANSKYLQDLGFKKTLLTFGSYSTADLYPRGIKFDKNLTTFELVYQKKSVGKFSIHIPGYHNILNATAAALVSKQIGIDWPDIQKGFDIFYGTKRRFEFIQKKAGCLFYDDYAHHPQEIKASLQGIKMWFPKHRIITVFQPHTFSRTKALLSEFSRCFGDSDYVIITEIYASAREKMDIKISGSNIVRILSKYHPHAIYAPNKEKIQDILKKIIHKDDICIFMGAGDIYNWEHDVINSI